MNVQHDCRASDRNASGSTPQLQEQQITDRVVHSIVHKDNMRFIINTHALHNAMLLCKFLLHYLTVPRLLFPDQHQQHTNIAVNVAAQQQAKWAVTKAKTAATRLRNKEAKEARTNQSWGEAGTSGNEHASMSTDTPSTKQKRAESNSVIWYLTHVTVLL